MSKPKDTTPAANPADEAEAKAKAEAAAKAQADADAAAAAAKEPKLVKMKRSEPVHAGGPVTADVHPDEVDNWIAGGWRRAG
ncbi:MAG TPA: hypothetical protein VGD45_20650 [Steroidobacter sp.]|uniref:hypothetical protein n=1 Tax=Steroidobacter sp. TaxID=1978227 RepID=UPI002EDA609D